MNKEQKCAVVCDLLPIYLEKLTCQATTEFVNQHLCECEACRRVKRAMENPITPAEQARDELAEGIRHAHRRSKRRVRMITLCVVLVLCAGFLPLPRAMNRTVSAVRWQPCTEEYEQITVDIRGTYFDFLFRTDYFSGDIAIEGIPQSQKPGRLSRVYINIDSYPLYWEDDDALLHTGGFIISMPGMRRFMIGLNNDDGSWDSNSGVNITVPATTREEAVSIANDVCHYNGGRWLSEINWE